MAEVLGIVASGISVAQMAGQLLTCIEQLRTFCRALRNIPEELRGVLNEIEILGDVFYHLGVLDSTPSQPGYSALRASLAHCQAAALKLQAVTMKSSSPLKADKKRAWNAIKAVLRREEAKELKCQLEAAKSLLSLALTCYSV